MIVDHHFHLEEGPYNTHWLNRTVEAIAIVEEERGGLTAPAHSLAWMEALGAKLAKRLTDGCFSQEWLNLYLERGKKLGIKRFGIVDHLYRFDEFRAYYEQHMIVDETKLGRLQSYWLDRVNSCSIEPFLLVVRQAEAAGYPISLGVEADYFPGGEAELRRLLAPYELDFVIGSVHFIDGWGFDNPQTEYLFKKQDLLGLYRRLFELVRAAAGTGLFDIVAHPDNLKVFNYRPDEELLLPMYEETAAALAAAGVATEINTGLAYRYPVEEMCPSPAFLQVLHKHGVPVTLSSDSHYPDDIGMLLQEAADLAMKSGYKEVVYFEKRQRYTLPL
ncbi:MAG: PHP domain-containing protein [Gorillibacterium sp.]|nr:PHP domain-containing protein [Gorillibacterium sp.]